MCSFVYLAEVLYTAILGWRQFNKKREYGRMRARKERDSENRERMIEGGRE